MVLVWPYPDKVIGPGHFFSPTCSRRGKPAKSAFFKPGQVTDPTAMNHYLTLTILGDQAKNLPERISKAIRDLGGNITECRLSKMGNDLSGILLVEGGWDAIAKIEAQVPRLEAELNLQIHSKRTETKKPAGAALPYGIDIVSSYRPGLVYEITRFMAEHDIEIHDLYTTTHQPDRHPHVHLAYDGKHPGGGLHRVIAGRVYGLL